MYSIEPPEKKTYQNIPKVTFNIPKSLFWYDASKILSAILKDKKNFFNDPKGNFYVQIKKGIVECKWSNSKNNEETKKLTPFLFCAWFASNFTLEDKFIFDKEGNGKFYKHANDVLMEKFIELNYDTKEVFLDNKQKWISQKKLEEYDKAVVSIRAKMTEVPQLIYNFLKHTKEIRGKFQLYDDIILYKTQREGNKNLIDDFNEFLREDEDLEHLHPFEAYRDELHGGERKKYFSETIKKQNFAIRMAQKWFLADAPKLPPKSALKNYQKEASDDFVNHDMRFMYLYWAPGTGKTIGALCTVMKKALNFLKQKPQQVTQMGVLFVTLAINVASTKFYDELDTLLNSEDWFGIKNETDEYSFKTEEIKTHDRNNKSKNEIMFWTRKVTIFKKQSKSEGRRTRQQASEEEKKITISFNSTTYLKPFHATTTGGKKKTKKNRMRLLENMAYHVSESQYVMNIFDEVHELKNTPYFFDSNERFAVDHKFKHYWTSGVFKNLQETNKTVNEKIQKIEVWQNDKRGGYSEGQKRWIWRLANVQGPMYSEKDWEKYGHESEKIKKYKVNKGQSYIFLSATPVDGNIKSFLNVFLSVYTIFLKDDALDAFFEENKKVLQKELSNETEKEIKNKILDLMKDLNGEDMKEKTMRYQPLDDTTMPLQNFTMSHHFRLPKMALQHGNMRHDGFTNTYDHPERKYLVKITRLVKFMYCFDFTFMKTHEKYKKYLIADSTKTKTRNNFVEDVTKDENDEVKYNTGEQATFNAFNEFNYNDILNHSFVDANGRLKIVNRNVNAFSSGYFKLEFGKEDDYTIVPPGNIFAKTNAGTKGGDSELLPARIANLISGKYEYNKETAMINVANQLRQATLSFEEMHKFVQKKRQESEKKRVKKCTYKEKVIQTTKDDLEKFTDENLKKHLRKIKPINDFYFTYDTDKKEQNQIDINQIKNKLVILINTIKNLKNMNHKISTELIIDDKGDEDGDKSDDEGNDKGDVDYTPDEILDDEHVNERTLERFQNNFDRIQKIEDEFKKICNDFNTLLEGVHTLEELNSGNIEQISKLENAESFFEILDDFLEKSLRDEMSSDEKGKEDFIENDEDFIFDDNFFSKESSTAGSEERKELDHFQVKKTDALENPEATTLDEKEITLLREEKYDKLDNTKDWKLIPYSEKLYKIFKFVSDNGYTEVEEKATPHVIFFPSMNSKDKKDDFVYCTNNSKTRHTMIPKTVGAGLTFFISYAVSRNLDQRLKEKNVYLPNMTTNDGKGIRMILQEYANKVKSEEIKNFEEEKKMYIKLKLSLLDKCLPEEMCKSISDVLKKINNNEVLTDEDKKVLDELKTDLQHPSEDSGKLLIHLLDRIHIVAAVSGSMSPNEGGGLDILLHSGTNHVYKEKPDEYSGIYNCPLNRNGRIIRIMAGIKKLAQSNDIRNTRYMHFINQNHNCLEVAQQEGRIARSSDESKFPYYKYGFHTSHLKLDSGIEVKPVVHYITWVNVERFRSKLNNDGIKNTKYETRHNFLATLHLLLGISFNELRLNEPKTMRKLIKPIWYIDETPETNKKVRDEIEKYNVCQYILGNELKRRNLKKMRRDNDNIDTEETDTED